eukprot:TRINITY_DN9139_c0_g2_i1.p1 TRINITY_DN9139_c0_g2~~TRINITY_DN9139_c0_g2_i1.p1  ORF type:complete len:295 (-),score=-4.85 TRINITY_DN9139_c0_g2_i1:34-918(-)
MASLQFVIEADEVESMANQKSLSLPHLLASLVKPAQKLARPPISNYPVGAVGLSSDGRIFLGVNLEFPGAPLYHSVHAEQFLITNSTLHGASRIQYIAVSSAPCGHCRQFLQEIRGASDIKILVTSDDVDADVAFRPLAYFLPHRFGPEDLLRDNVPYLLEPHHNSLVLNDCVEPRNGEIGVDLKRAALDAANVAHAPYSKCPSGVALVDSEGRVFVGSYLESAAYNPSLAPVQAALVAYVVRGGGRGYGEIVGGVLVEKKDAVVRQESTARVLLQAISPSCDFRVFHCRYVEK